ncbi:MAG: c-type cytochrome [Bdellovibrionales bacterium]|nr:c-type cytochrome [Bdellovibrionales bacterium]
MSDHHSNQQHHILSNSMAAKIFGTLLVLTVVTVWVAQFDLGALNFTVAMLVASVKAALVCLFFMGLKYDHKENTVIFSTSFLFLVIFMILTFSDLLTRGDVYVKDMKKIIPDGAVATQSKSKYESPWVSNAELIAHGKELFAAQCVTCHGAGGGGDGVAAAGLNPKPRNFTVSDGWKNGRKPSAIYVTLTKGLNSMPAFASLPSDDRWALAHYVRTLGPHESEKDSPEDLRKSGIDASGGGSGGGEKQIPIGVAIDLMSQSR